MKIGKKWIFLSMFSIICLLTANSQVKVNVNVNVQPPWGPAFYDYVAYYYIPEAGIYYYVPDRVFIYPEGHQWRFSRVLPPRYHINLFSTYKVVINQPKPYLHHGYYVTHYRNKKQAHQVCRRDFHRNRGNNRKIKG
jgi:hypothetical protein